MRIKTSRSSMLAFWVMLLVGVAIGGLLSYIGSVVGGPVGWLNLGTAFQVGSSASPFVLDLSVIKITFALAFKMDIATVIGIISGLLVWKYVF